MKVSYKDMELYAITDNRWLNGRKLSEVVEDILNNGATFLQLRDKEATHEELVAEAKELKVIAAKYKVPFVVNDDVLLQRKLMPMVSISDKAIPLMKKQERFLDLIRL